MNPVSVRPSRPSDFNAWLPLWRGYQLFYKADIPDAVTRETWRRFHDDAEPMHCTLAERDGRVVGNEHASFAMRWFWRYELEHLLARAGFREIEIHGDFDRSPISADSPAFVVVAR